MHEKCLEVINSESISARATVNLIKVYELPFPTEAIVGRIDELVRRKKFQLASDHVIRFNVFHLFDHPRVLLPLIEKSVFDAVERYGSLFCLSFFPFLPSFSLLSLLFSPSSLLFLLLLQVACTLLLVPSS